MADETGGRIIQPVGHSSITEPAFHAINWLFVAICTLAYLVRVYIRYVSFRKLTVEDWLMLVALVMHNATAIIAQLFIRHIFVLEAAERGDYSVVDEHFFDNCLRGLKAFGSTMVLTITGITIVKVNFLIFFRRIGRELRWFSVVWWGVLIFVLGTGASQIGMHDFKCVFSDADYIFTLNCTSNEARAKNYFNAIFSAAVDATSDALILVLPTIILWHARIERRKKILLGFVFGLVALTIGVTITRGSVSHDVYQTRGDEQGKEQSISWTWFWFYIESSTAYLVACIVNFRTLFVQRNNMSRERNEVRLRREQLHRSALRRGWLAKAKFYHDSVLVETCKEIEGSWSDTDETLHLENRLPVPASGLMTVDFGNDENWSKAVPPGTAQSQAISLQSLEPTHAPRQGV
ncbi:hypothetical protein QBC35DRAFT_47172 [Podospora australis]|uniref:Rhodopsin domain-containing protein n=1 Tax=Podospora australis TaxID=1536484 RepID=A0AAN7AG74_9PEZI|nr:hypothetical protein QBC35DRAFT_47172 [Podospora australis]